MQPAMEWLSPPSYIYEGIELGKLLNNVTKVVIENEDGTTTTRNANAAEQLAAFFEASDNARLYASSYYNASYDIYYAIDHRPTNALQLIAADYVSEQNAANPYPIAKPSRLTRPNANNYELGENDPQYIIDRAEYVAQEKVYYDWYVAEANYKYEFEIDLIEQAAAEIPAYAPFANVVNLAIEGQINYNADPNDKDIAFEAVDAYEALDNISKLFIEKYSRNLFVIIKETGSSLPYSYTNMRPSKLIEICSDIKNEELLFDFIDVINGIIAPFTRQDIETAKAAYDLVPTSLRTRIPEETNAKYKAILASIAPDVPSTDAPVIEGRPVTEVNYPRGVSEKGLESQAANLLDIVLKLLDIDVATLLTENIYTNAAMASITKVLFPALADLSSLISAGPGSLAKALNMSEPEKFAGAIAALNAAVTEFKANGDEVVNQDDWDKVAFENGDWGFEDGDREGFIDSIAASFRALSILTLAINFENNINTSNGTYTYNAYEDLIKILEGLGLRGVISSHDYTLDVNAEENSLKKMDKRIRPILVPIFNLIDDIAADPLAGVLDLLPKLAMVVNENILNDQINKILSEMSFVSVDPIDLTTAGLAALISEKVAEIELEAAVVDEEGNEITPAVLLGLEVDQEAFIKLIEDLAGCGTYVAVDSVGRNSIYTIGIDSDRPTDVYLLLFNWLYGEISTRENTNTIKNALAYLGLGVFENIAISIVLETFYRTDVNHLFTILNLALPLAKIFMSFEKLFKTFNFSF